MNQIIRMVDVALRNWKHHAQERFSIEINEGDFVLIQGPNGTGKSYLLNLMAALKKPDSGEVYLTGKRLTRMSVAEKTRWRSRLGLIPSEIALLNGYSVEENLRQTAQLLGKTAKQAQEYAEESAALCGLSGVLHVKVDTLSDGMKKRVVIARALVNQPIMILADSPLEGLDKKAQEGFLYLCTKLSQIGYSIVMTSSAPLSLEIGALRTINLNPPEL